MPFAAPWVSLEIVMLSQSVRGHILYFNFEQTCTDWFYDLKWSPCILEIMSSAVVGAFCTIDQIGLKR